MVTLIDPFKGTLIKAQGFLISFLHYEVRSDILASEPGAIVLLR